MSKILTKHYKHWQPGTALTSDQDEFMRVPGRDWPVKPIEIGAEQAFGTKPGTVYVNAERMAQLEKEGYFDA